MKRFLNRFSRTAESAGKTESDDNGITAASPANAPPTEAPRTPQGLTGGADEAPMEIELREPTEEELNASFLSRQDFQDLDRIMAHSGRPIPAAETQPPTQSLPVRTPPPAKDETSSRLPLAPTAPEAPKPDAALPPVPSSNSIEATTAAPGEGQASPPSTGLSPHRGPIAPFPLSPSVADGKKLIGFWDGLVVGEFLFGWVGNPDDPACRSIKVAAVVDGREVAATIATIARGDTPHAGFRIDFSDKGISQYLLEDRIRLVAQLDGFAPTDLIALPAILDIARDHRTRELEKAGEQVGQILSPPKDVAGLSLFRLPVGLQSPNGAAIIGREGFLFPHRGADDLIGQYTDRSNPQIQIDAGAWQELFTARERHLGERGIAYVQSILPEKATILHSLAPSEPHQITARLGAIEGGIADRIRADPEACRYYRSFVTALRTCHSAGMAPFLRLDDRLRTIGAQLCFYQLVQQCAALLDRREEFERIAALCGQVAPTSHESAPFSGGLARQFRFPMYETELIPSLPEIEALQPDASAIENHGSEGRRRTWLNPKAPSSLRMLAFGDFSIEQGSQGIGWWMRAMFRELSLVDNVAIDLGLVDRWKPDIVLCLTAERRLTQVPLR